MLDIAVVLVYFAVLAGIGWWGYYRAKTPEDFLVAGRRLGLGMYIGTLSAVVLGGASTLGGVALGYEFGLSGMWLVFMLGLGIIALGALISSRLNRLGLYTIAELLELRYHRWARLIGGVVAASYAAMVTVTATVAIGTVFDELLGLPTTWAVIIGGGLTIAYSAVGGMWSISFSDFVQFIVMTVGIVLILLPMSLAAGGGLGQIQQTLDPSFFDITAIGVDTIFGYFLLYFLGILIGQDIWQRVFTARSAKIARSGAIIAGLYCLGYAVTGALIGTAARAVLPDLDDPDLAFSAIALEVLPVGLLGLIVAAALAAIMSTASSTLLASSTILANDVFARFVSSSSQVQVRTNRLFMVAVGVVVIGVALAVGDIVGALTIAYNLLVGGLFVPVVGALFWKRATSAGASAAIAAGAVTVVVFMITHGMFANEPIMYGVLVSLVAFVIVSLVTPRTDPEQLRAWQERMGTQATDESAS